ncbi:DUF397 domain-containing protein [Streptomyces sp. H27-D2]|uniref:DUF397 domain-containing protein n=1 Tax=Streptomyces sp. H27-D2 TaxID=3046304 RepID=UPI002DBE2766|nr:DUF397 domain-containing protein [Streptomyces sp. H27-D2]MEC4018235.1 DUF397 domain-containing protein [Streptomyces sp. H27-D2]
MSDNPWQESSFCQSGNSCVGVRRDGGALHMRESEYPEEAITTTPERMRAFIVGVKAGEYDHLVQ